MASASAVPPTSTGATAASVTSRSTIAQNFNTFLQLLTTQLKNQNPLDPLDTNQFTQQLVQFAQVEQQMNTNTSLGTLVSLQQTAQSTAALGFLGSTVTVNGNTITDFDYDAHGVLRIRFANKAEPQPVRVEF